MMKNSSLGYRVSTAPMMDRAKYHKKQCVTCLRVRSVCSQYRYWPWLVLLNQPGWSETTGPFPTASA